jgi:hypothetical protein
MQCGDFIVPCLSPVNQCLNRCLAAAHLALMSAVIVVVREPVLQIVLQLFTRLHDSQDLDFGRSSFFAAAFSAARWAFLAALASGVLYAKYAAMFICCFGSSGSFGVSRPLPVT